jgi:hypothetical protein
MFSLKKSELNDQQALETSVICFVNNYSITQVAFSLRRFFAHQVAHSCAVALYFPGASHLKSLFGAGVGLHFRHDPIVRLEKWSAKIVKSEK